MTKSTNLLAVVTGASGGIGSEIARVLSDNGWNLALIDRHIDESVVAACQANGVDVIAIAADVGDESAIKQMYPDMEKRFRRVPDLLVNNAGVQTWSSLLELELTDWQRTITTNLTGCFLNTREYARLCVNHSHAGNVVNIGSGCNHLAFPKLIDYVASKGGIEMFTKSAALDLGPHNIRVNCIAPGAIATERTLSETGDYANDWGALTPLQRIGTPADIAGAVLLLTDKNSQFITGETIRVDGGLFARSAWPTDY